MHQREAPEIEVVKYVVATIVFAADIAVHATEGHFGTIWSVVMKKSRGRFAKLQELVATTGIDGEWIKKRQPTQYRADSGAILNYWESTGTVNFQGPPSAAHELEAAMFPISTGRTGACSSQPNARRTTINDAGLQALTRSIIKNRVGPILDNESAFIAKVAEQCMFDLVEQLGLPACGKEMVGTSEECLMNHCSAEGGR